MSGYDLGQSIRASIGFFWNESYGQIYPNLKNLAVDYLKIDGSFFKNLARDTVNQAMVTAMIRLARSLNFKVIAEQVEDASALDAARRMGVDYLQGYAIGRPEKLAMAA